jgi:hypothetical protein
MGGVVLISVDAPMKAYISAALSSKIEHAGQNKIKCRLSYLVFLILF